MPLCDEVLVISDLTDDRWNIKLNLFANNHDGGWYKHLIHISTLMSHGFNHLKLHHASYQHLQIEHDRVAVFIFSSVSTFYSCKIEKITLRAVSMSIESWAKYGSDSSTLNAADQLHTLRWVITTCQETLILPGSDEERGAIPSILTVKFPCRPLTYQILNEMWMPAKWNLRFY